MDPKIKREDASLSQFYNDLKSDMNRPEGAPMIKLSGGMMPNHMHPGVHRFHHCADVQAKKLANDCHKHMLLDIYMKVVPLDQDYVDGHRGQFAGDIDSMLAAKGMNATQYLTSCYEATNAPLVEFLLRSGNLIARQFREAAEETLKDAQAKDVEVPAPEAPKTDDSEVQDQLVDVKEDPEYTNFIDKLKEKTIKKIVNDVSKIIANKKDEKAMTFDTTPGTSMADAEAQVESTTSVGVNYINKRLFIEFREVERFRADRLTDDKKYPLDFDPDERVFVPPASELMKRPRKKDDFDPDERTFIPSSEELRARADAERAEKMAAAKARWSREKVRYEPVGDGWHKLTLADNESVDMTDQMLGLAIREATLNEINTCFKQPGTSFREYATRIRLGKGYVITESAISVFVEEISEQAKQAVNDAAAKTAENGTKLAETLEQAKKDQKAGTEKIEKSVDGNNPL